MQYSIPNFPAGSAGVLDFTHRCCAGLFRWSIYCRHWPLFGSHDHPVGIFPKTRIIFLAKNVAGFDLGRASDGSSYVVRNSMQPRNICDFSLEQHMINLASIGSRAWGE